MFGLELPDRTRRSAHFCVSKPPWHRRWTHFSLFPPWLFSRSPASPAPVRPTGRSGAAPPGNARSEKARPEPASQLPGAFRDLAHQTERFSPNRLSCPVLPADRFEPGAGNSRSTFSGRPIGPGIRIDCCQRTAISELSPCFCRGKMVKSCRPSDPPPG